MSVVPLPQAERERSYGASVTDRVLGLALRPVEQAAKDLVGLGRKADYKCRAPGCENPARSDPRGMYSRCGEHRAGGNRSRSRPTSGPCGGNRGSLAKAAFETAKKEFQERAKLLADGP